MLTNLPPGIIAGFLLTVALTFFLFVNAAKNKASTALIFLIWLVITGILSFNDVFQKTDSFPPRLMIAMAPPLVLIIVLLTTKPGTRFTDSLSLSKLTLVHIVRLPVEIILFLLASHKLVPELMTFTGRNFDIVSGLTAPVVYFLCFRDHTLKHKKILLAWNFICLGLLLNIVVNALLSAPFPIQRFAFDQPNVAVLYFPFTWLPCFIVVLVLFSQLAAIRQLLRLKQ